MINFILGTLAFGLVTTVYCVCTAQLVDDDYNPLEPQKKLRNIFKKAVEWFEGLNDHLALSLLIVLFFSLVYLVNRIIFNIH